MYYVYILLLSNKQLYTGLTDNLKKRFSDHNNDRVSSTRKRRPLKLIFYEAFLTKRDALKRERYLKTSKGKSTLRMMLKYTLNQI